MRIVRQKPKNLYGSWQCCAGPLLWRPQAVLLQRWRRRVLFRAQGGRSYNNKQQHQFYNPNTTVTSVIKTILKEYNHLEKCCHYLPITPWKIPQKVSVRNMRTGCYLKPVNLSRMPLAVFSAFLYFYTIIALLACKKWVQVSLTKLVIVGPRAYQ